MHILSNVFQKVENILSDQTFIKNNINSEKDFSRKRILGFKDVVYCVCSSQKHSLNFELSSFFMKTDGKLPCFSPQAFSKARYKIKSEAFYTIFRESARLSCTSTMKTLKGYRILAVDGTSLLLPSSKGNEETFGTCGNQSKMYASASASIFYDIMNDIVLDAVIGRQFCSERQDCYDMLGRTGSAFTGEKKLLILDRGYPSREMFHFLESHGYKYLIRLPSCHSKAIKEAGGPDNTVTDYRDPSLVQRVIKVTLPSGETEVLVTNLFDKEFTVQDFYELYHMRWPIETKYLDIKCKLELEKFTGYRPEGIRQDFFAALFIANLSALLKQEAEERRESVPGTKWRYQVSITAVIYLLRENMARILYVPSEREDMLGRMAEALKNKRLAVRPDRHAKRKRPRTVRRYSLNHK